MERALPVDQQGPGVQFLLVRGSCYSTGPSGLGGSCTLEPLICHQRPHGPHLQGA